MNELETKLTLWAICSVILFEILVIICLFRFYFNRVRPKKFYLKREEYECLPNGNSKSQGKFQSTILRPPHADELALVGTIRGPYPILTYHSGIRNPGFYASDEDKKMAPILSSSSSSSSSQLSQRWIDLPSTMINTANLPPSDYEIHSYPTDNYGYRHSTLPRATIIDLSQYRQEYNNYDDDENDQPDIYQFQSFRRSNVIRPSIKRTDTSTEFYGMNYTNVIPKSILKSSTSITPPVDFLSSPYLTTQRTQASSLTLDQSPEISIKFTSQRTIPIYYPTNVDENQTSIEPTLPLTSRYQMKFASISHLNDVQWEVPREFKTIIQDNDIDNREPINSSTTIDPRILLTHRSQINIPRPYYLTKSDITQQKAFEY